jgi:hypothetical protein
MKVLWDGKLKILTKRDMLQPLILFKVGMDCISLYAKLPSKWEGHHKSRMAV